MARLYNWIFARSRRELVLRAILTSWLAATPALSQESAPTTPIEGERPSATFQAGPVGLTPGGFIEFTAIYRTRNETADIGSSFGAVPFPSNPNYKEGEFRQTERNSRFSLLAQGPPDGQSAIEGYFESDFVSAGTTSNSNESNSYTLRVRQLFLNWSRVDWGWSVTAGQTWSLATMLNKGLAPRSEDIPLVDDGQYVTGFVWTRQPQLRIVKTMTPQFALGLSLESPQNITKGTPPEGTLSANPGGAGNNDVANYSTDIAPDAIVKIAYDPTHGHYELFSMTRFFHDRSPTIPGVISSEAGHTTPAESAGGGLILSLWPHRVDLHMSGLTGHGNGRYGSAQLGDSTYDTTDGSIAALRQTQGLIGLIGHATRDLDFFTYYGYEDQKAAFLLVPKDNTACDTPYVDVGNLAPTAGCGSVGIVRQYVGGLQWKFYKGKLGYLTGGPEIEYVQNATYTARNGTVGRTDEAMFYLTVRYFPFQ